MTPLFDMVQKWFVTLPHCAALGLEFAGLEGDKATFRVDYRPELVGNGCKGIVHGGVITSLIDTTSALSVFAKLEAALR